jgi:ABC-type uncharacterized transport system substrate-binding protein
VNLAVKSRLPVIYPFPEFVEAGGLISYGVSFGLRPSGWRDFIEI